MYLDEHKSLVMEQCGSPGNIGDSCAETSRLFNLLTLLGKNKDGVSLNSFVTQGGFIRHTDAPSTWRETDFSDDQLLPLYVAARNSNDMALKQLIEQRIKSNGWKTGNIQYIHPITYAYLNEIGWLKCLSTFGQQTLFALPWRWNDQYHKFEEMKDSSADYLNFIHYAHETSAKVWISKEILKTKIEEYYKKEPNSEWVVSLYKQFIDEFYK